MKGVDAAISATREGHGPDRVGGRGASMAVPDGAATAVDPPLPGRIPGFRGGCHRIVLERLAWITGNDKPSPGLRAGLGIVCSDVAPHAILGAVPPPSGTSPEALDRQTRYLFTNMVKVFSLMFTVCDFASEASATICGINSGTSTESSFRQSR